MNRTWLNSLRTLFEKSFSYNWKSHVQTLNQEYGLTGDDELKLPVPGHPPVWFNGDVEAIEPSSWVLVVSLNHQLGADKVYPDQYGPLEFWDIWRLHNRKHWYPRFFRPLVKVASCVLGENVAEADEAEFATYRMVFVELLPYASAVFRLSLDDIQTLISTDRGFTLASQVRTLLIEGAQPALILANGNHVKDVLAKPSFGGVEWKTCTYPSVAKTDKTLRHYEGVFQAADQATPIAGFPFLRTPKSHNSNSEILQLGEELHRMLRDRI